LETIIGENGFTLSGGQKHRLGIARALYSDPELLFLDEATNALDEITEKVINNYIYEKLNNKTIVTISHKFSTIKHSDIVYKIKDGELLRLK
jgi:ABC-type bacteriocin/lantibiotic exporter with double-glycine peptidase domain